MPIARVELPNGKVGRFEVPDGTTPQQAEAMAMQSWQQSQGSGAEVRPAEPGFIERATSNVSPVNDPSKMAGMGTQAVASLPTDMKERAAYFAKQRFPNDPDAISKYGVQDGRLFYFGDDGKPYFEEPTLGVSRKEGDILPRVSPTETAKYVASGAGPMLPIAGSIAGGIAGEALNPLAGGIPAAGVGAAAGDEVRQALAMALAGQENFSPMQTAKEAGMGAFGQGLGAGAVKLANRNAARDIAKAMTPEALARQDYLDSAAKEFGISLSPGERTELPSLLGRQQYLSSSPYSADTMSKNLYKPRNEEQVPAGVNKMLGRISPVESAEVGSTNLQAGAEGAIKFAKEERKAASAPLYKEVFPKKISTNHFINISNTNRLIRNAIDSAENDEVTLYFIEKYQRETGKEISKNSVGYLDAVKQSLDNKAAAALRAGEDKRAAAYAESAAELRKKIDALVPGYKEARAAYAGESPAVTALTEGEAGLVSKMSPAQVSGAPKTMFETGPDAVGRNRAAFIKAGKEQEWNAGLRAHLQQNFDAAAKEFASGNANPGARFRAKVFGTGQQKLALQRAMTPEQWAGFNRLMDVLEASGKAPGKNSVTHFAGMEEKAMRKESASVPGKVLRAMNPKNLFDTSNLANWLDDIKFGKYSEELAEITTSPDAMNKLKALRALPPNSEKARVIVGQVLSQYGFGKAREPSDAPPGSFSGAPANQRKAQ